MSTSPWRVLVVDDEEDIHNITTLALRRKAWRGRSIGLEHARSAAEARKILEGSAFHCALVDVVMETDDAGLRLCEHIRATAPRTTRIVLRTGQPGAAPPERVLQEYDIDQYLAKADVNAERLFGALRACFRTSLDIATLSAVAAQLRSFTDLLRDPAATTERLASVMEESLRFLEEKYSARVVFVADTRAPPPATAGATPEKVVLALADAAATPGKIRDGVAHGLAPEAIVAATRSLQSTPRADQGVSERVKRWFTTIFSDDDTSEVTAGVIVVPEAAFAPNLRDELGQDLEVLLANWRLADESLRLQGKLTRERLEVAQHFGPRT